MQLLINPKFAHLRNYLLELEAHFEDQGKPLYRGVSRNEMRTLTVDGLTLWVKRYGKTKMKHKLRPWRRSQAEKAYIGPLRLRERGFESPEPVAYVSIRTGLFSHRRYFVSLKMDLRFTMEDFVDVHEEERAEGIVAFARFVARLHNKGVVHTNFASKNILFDTKDGHWHFALAETNRIKTKRHIGQKEGCRNFARLTGTTDFFEQVATAYAEARGFDPEECRHLILEAHEQWEATRKF